MEQDSARGLLLCATNLCDYKRFHVKGSAYKREYDDLARDGRR